jgi:hypothetical protein
MKKILYITLALVAFSACEKEPESPPVNKLNPSQIITIDSLRAMQIAVSPGELLITDSLHTYGIVTMDESSGNIYKNLYVQDVTAGINIRLTEGSDFAEGDSVRISLIGALLSEYNGVIQLDQIDPTTAIIRQSGGNQMTPATRTIAELTVDDEALLIQLNNVQFTAGELANSYADGINQASENRIIEDCDGNTVIIRTSGFADYAGDIVAQGNGSITCIVNRFGEELQLLIRHPDDIKMDAQRCAGQILTKDFDDDDVNSGGWISVQVSGPSVDWETSTAGGAATPYGVISNYNGSTNDACENWLVSPSMNLSGTTSPSMQFMNAYNFSGPALQLMISTDYSGSGDPSLGTWVDISSQVTWSPGGFAFVNSGVIDLSAYLQPSVHIAFVYAGGASNGSSWELDDIIING